MECIAGQGDAYIRVAIVQGWEEPRLCRLNMLLLEEGRLPTVGEDARKGVAEGQVQVPGSWGCKLGSPEEEVYADEHRARRPARVG